MGEVWQARHLALNARFAVKLLHPALASRESMVQRFLNEAQVTARLKTRYAVQVVDFGIAATGEPFLVMELLEGETIARRLERISRLPVATTALFLSQVARALDRAHALGIIHRDLKPENLFVVKDEEGREYVKVTDFGIAKILRSPEAEPASEHGSAFRLSTLTRDGTRLGTPHYMAPEQIEGSDELGPATDIWALGVVAFECLAGSRPFVGADLPALFAAIRIGPRLVARSPSPEVPAAFDSWFQRASAPKPGDRFPSAGEAARELARALDVPEVAELPLAATEPPEDVSRDLAALAPTIPSTTEQTGLVGSGNAGSDRTPGSAATDKKRSFARGAALGLLALAVTFAARMWSRHGATTAAGPPETTAVKLAAAAQGPKLAFRPTHLRRITFGEGCEEFPSFSPDGREVYFDGVLGKGSAIFAMTYPDGPPRAVTHGPLDIAPAVSPDGKSVAYESLDDPAVWIAPRPSDAGAPRLLVHGHSRPAWSKDGQGIWAEGVMKPVTLVAADDGHVLRTWPVKGARLIGPRLELSDGTLAVDSLPLVPNTTSGIGLLDRAGAFRWLFQGETDEVLTATPDEAFLLIMRRDAEQRMALLALPRDGSEPIHLDDTGVAARKGAAFSPDGRAIVWSDCQARLSAALVDGRGHMADLAPTSSWTDTFVTGIPGSSRAVLISNRNNTEALWVVDLDEAAPPRRIATGDLKPLQVAASPDGKWLAFTTDVGLHVVDTAGETAPKRLTSRVEDVDPTFRSDSRTLLFATKSEHGGPYQVMVTDLDGSPPRPFLGPGTDFPVASPVDSTLLYLTGPAETRMAMITDGHGHTRRLSRSLPAMPIKNVPAFSPDGRFVGFVKNTGEGFVEVEVATGKITREIDPAPDELSAATYTSKGLLFARTTWVGDLWTADLSP